MRRVLLLLAAMLACFVITGCASQLTTSYSGPQAYSPANTMLYNASLDKTWDAAIKSISEKFFVLDNIVKDSRIITLSFSAQDPSEYLDCGVITHSLSGGVSGNGDYIITGASPRTELLAPDGTPHPKPAVRTTKLEGKINIILIEEGKNRTRATVTVRYVMPIRFDGHRAVAAGWSVMMVPYSYTATVSLTTGQNGLIDNGGMTTCVTKYTLEKIILDGIQSNL